MVYRNLGAVLILVFSVTALFAAAGNIRNDEALHEHVHNLTRRECVEAYDANGQQIVDDEGEPQFNCDNYFPTTESIQARIASTGLVNDPTKIPAYYTGWPYNEVEGELGGWISEWMDAFLARQPSPQPQATGYYWWWTAVPRDWWYAQNTWFINHQGDGQEFVFPPKMSSTFDACISESLATMNVGKEIFLFVPSEYVLGSEPNRQWWSIEYPILTNNPAVEMIYRIDPRPAADGHICGERVIWAKQFKPQPQTWFCADTARPLPPPPPAQQDSMSRLVPKTTANSRDHSRLFRRECWAEEDMDGNWEYDAEQCDEFLPTLGQCQGNLQQNGFINDPGYVPVYYTGWPGGTSFQDVTTWIASYMALYVTDQGARPKGWYWFWSALHNDWYKVQRQYITDNFAQLKNVNLEGDSLTADAANEVLTVCLCEALAVSCLAPTVVVAVPYDYVLGSEAGRHWWTIEFGALTRNVHVNRIYRVDPSPLDTLENPETKCNDEGRWIPKLIWTRGVDPEAPQRLTCAMFLKTGPNANPPPHAVLQPPPPAPLPPSPPSLPPAKREEAQSVETIPNATHFNEFSRRECVATTDVMTGEVQYLPDNCGTLAPTLADCVEHWNQKGDDGVILISDTTKLPIYYTGWNKDEDSKNMYTWFASFAANYIKVQEDPKENGWYWFWSTWDKDWYDVQEAYLEGHEDEIENIKPKGQGLDLGAILDGCMNEAFATNCIHPRVFLMVPQDYVLGSEPKRHWWSIEFGALTKNPNVQEIFRIDPRPRDPDEEGCTGYAPVLIWSRSAGDEEHPMDFNCDIFVSDTVVPKLPPPGLLMERSQGSDFVSPTEKSESNLINSSAATFVPSVSDASCLGSGASDIGGGNRHSRGRLRRRPTCISTDAGVSTPQKRFDQRQCTERTPGLVDTRWDCDLNLATIQQFITQIPLSGLKSQRNTYVLYFTGFDNNDIVIGGLKGQIAAWTKWYIQCIQDLHQSDSSSFSKYWYWYFDVVYDKPGVCFVAQEEWTEMQLPPNAMDDEDVQFSEEAPQWFGKCTSQAFATACEQATIILFAPYDPVLADQLNRHFYVIEDDVLTRTDRKSHTADPKFRRVIHAETSPPEDPTQPRSMPTVIWDRANPAMNAQIRRIFDCEDDIGNSVEE